MRAEWFHDHQHLLGQLALLIEVIDAGEVEACHLSFLVSDFVQRIEGADHVGGAENEREQQRDQDRD